MKVTIGSLCVLCGSDRVEFAPRGIEVLRRCQGCGLVATAPHGRAAAVYDDEYYSSGGYRAYFARERQWRFEARRRLAWLLQGGVPRTLLEAGSAGGFFLEAAVRAGVSAIGVEVADPAAAYARDVLGVPVIHGFFEEADLPGGFDAVCAFHVLEHVAQPAAFLERARSVMEPGGRLALEVPNIESATALEAGSGWDQLQPEYHRWHFSPPTLTRLVESCGFGIDRCDTIYAAHYQRPGRRLMRAAVTGRRSRETEHPSLGDEIRLLARAVL